MKSIKCLILSLILVSSAAFADSDEVIVFQRKSGVVSETAMSRSDYTGKMGRVFSSVNKSVIPSLDTHKNPDQWSLRAAIVGLNINFEAGLGPIIGIGARSRFLLIYTREGDDYVPDL